MNKYYIGFDCGTQSTKTAIYDQHMNCVAEEQIPTIINYPKAGWAEMDADHYLQSVRDGIRACVEKSGINPSQIRAICGDGIICGIVGVDEDGKAITPYIPYLDIRGAEDAQWINENLEPLWIEESGNSTVDPYMPPVYIRWLLKNHEEFKKRGAKVVNNGPYVLARLCGHKAKDFFLDYATLSGWLVGYKAIEKEWSKAQMDSLGIPMEILPKIVAPSDIVGHLSAEEAALIGIPAGIPIVAGAGDTMQSNVGVGLTDVGMAADVAGTAAMITIVVDGINPEITRNTNLLFSIGTMPDTYFYWGHVRTGGLSLRWFRDNICGCADDNSYYDALQQAAEKVPAGSNGTLFIPYLQGGVGVLENASGCFLNMTTNTNQGEQWRAILESIAFEYLSLVDALRKNGNDITRLTVTEGGSKSGLWNQIKADCLDTTVITLKQSAGAVMSNAALAAYGVGDVADLRALVNSWVEVKDTYTPNAENTAAYRKIFTVQQKLLKETMPASFALLKELK